MGAEKKYGPGENCTVFDLVVHFHHIFHIYAAVSRICFRVRCVALKLAALVIFHVPKTVKVKQKQHHNFQRIAFYIN